MTGTAPRISVLVTTHNGGALLGECLDSVLAQRCGEFELVVVDDVSTDGATPALLAGYAARDARIRVLRPDRNLGVVGARNFGFAACRGEYLAALDHDDRSHPDRLGAQLAHLEANPRVVLLGTTTVLEEGGRRRVTDYDTPGTPLAMRWALHVDNPLTWSSVMLRATAVRRLGAFMRAEFEYADDYDLHHRLLGLGEIARLDAALTTYRWHAHNTTHRRAAVLFRNAARVLERAFQPWLGEDAATAAMLVVLHLSERVPPPDLATLERLGAALEGVLAGFCATHIPRGEDGGRARAEVAALAGQSWWRATRAAARSGVPGALGAWRRRAVLRQGVQPGAVEWAGSLLVGQLRMVPVMRPLIAGLRRRRP
jgi:GT2 family glycosyltransferase